MKLTIVSLSDDNRRKLSDVTFPLLKHYCEKKGYGCVCHTSLLNSNLCSFWNKFPAVERELPSNDWVMWMDADIAIINDDYDLVGLIESFGNKDFLISTDSNGLCSGAFMLRNCEWSYQFLRTLMFLGCLKPELNVSFGVANTLSDQNPIKVLANHWTSVYDRIGFIPDTEIMNPSGKFRKEGFAYHYWANNGNTDHILHCIASMIPKK